MTPFQEFLNTQPTIRVLEGFDKRAAIAAGVIPNLASKWEAIHKVYCLEDRNGSGVVSLW